MAHNAEAVASYNFSPKDKLLLDTNIWLLVYGPQKPVDSRVKIYSQALSKILAAKSRIYIDVVIVSEFINAYARQKWKLVAPRIKKFKAFRESAGFKSVAQNIAADVQCVLKYCTLIERGFKSLEIDTLIDEYALGHSDFNDQILAILCKKEGLKLLTDDSDFKRQDVTLITANKELLT